MTSNESACERTTRLLLAVEAGDGTAAHELLPLVYDELRDVARRMVGSRRDTPLRPTALVHDAYLKLASHDRPWDGRRHFLCVATKAMRQILTDKARELNAQKRGGTWRRVTLDEGAADAPEGATAVDLIVLDEALTELSEADERSASIVEMRYLAGMTIEEVASSLGISVTTVKDDWRAARAWLLRRMSAVD